MAPFAFDRFCIRKVRHFPWKRLHLAAARPWPDARRVCMYCAVRTAGNAGWLEILYFAVMVAAVAPRACSPYRGARGQNGPAWSREG